MGQKRKRSAGIRLIKKANRLVESRYKFDIWETRVFLSVLSQINKDDGDFQVYRIWYKDVIKTFGINSGKSYELLRGAAKGLMKKVFYVSNSDAGHKRETEYHIIRSVNYLSEGEKNVTSQEYIDITIEPEMKPLLLQLGNAFVGGKKVKGELYTAYDLQNIVKLKAYHVRIYELLKQYQKIGHRKLEVEEIRRMLELTTEYPKYGNFFQKVIKPSIGAINKYTDLFITNVEKVKQGRKVFALMFRFREKTSEELLQARGIFKQNKIQFPNKVIDTEENVQDKLFDYYYETVVSKFGVTPSSFLKLLNEGFSQEQIEKAIRVTRRMNVNNEIKKNIAGFFVKALRESYTDATEEAVKRKTDQKEKRNDIEEQIIQIIKDRNKRVSDRIKKLVNEDSGITLNAIKQIRTDVTSSHIISSKETELGREISVEDFREDSNLRDLVIMRIVNDNQDYFQDIFDDSDKLIRNLRSN